MPRVSHRAPSRLSCIESLLGLELAQGQPWIVEERGPEGVALGPSALNLGSFPGFLRREAVRSHGVGREQGERPAPAAGT